MWIAHLKYSVNPQLCSFVLRQEGAMHVIVDPLHQMRGKRNGFAP